METNSKQEASLDPTKCDFETALSYAKHLVYGMPYLALTARWPQVVQVVAADEQLNDVIPCWAVRISTSIA